MKKLIFTILCNFLFLVISWGQGCSPLQVSTNPDNAFNDEVGQNVTTSPYLNNFDWLTSDYHPLNYVVNNSQLLSIQSPFEDPNNVNYNKLSTPTGIKDYYTEDGWELLNENITSSNRTDIIHFMLYNKYSSVVRVLFAIEEPSFTGFNFVAVRLTFESSYNINAMFHPSGSIAQTLDKTSLPSAFVTLPLNMTDADFMVADFPVEYDPCICFKDNLSKIQARFTLIQNHELNLNNIPLSIDSDITNSHNNTDVNNFLVTGTGSVNGQIVTMGTLIFESIDELISEYEQIKEDTPNYENKLQQLQKAKNAITQIATAATVKTSVINGGTNPEVIAIGTTNAIAATAELSEIILQP